MVPEGPSTFEGHVLSYMAGLYGGNGGFVDEWIVESGKDSVGGLADFASGGDCEGW